MKQAAIDHMNKDHVDIVEIFCKKFGAIEEPTNIRVTDLSEDGMEITCDQKVVFVPFFSKADPKAYRHAIIEVYNSVKEGADYKSVTKSMLSLIDNSKSLMISSVRNEQGIISYAPFVRDGNEIYICISAVAEHYHSIKANPDKISVMFIEDEKDSKNIFARIRASFEASAEIIREENQKEAAFDKITQINPEDPAFKMIRDMKDFFPVKITLKKGRYVKGFGGAYDAIGLEIINQAKSGNPHQQKNSHSNH